MHKVTDLKTIQFSEDTKHVQWLNTYGLHYMDEARTILEQNKLDDFVWKLMKSTEINNKVIKLHGLLYFTIWVLDNEDDCLDPERMIFIASLNFVWSIQEKEGHHFEWIRKRLEQGKGIVRQKKADYLLFLLLESIIDNYQETFKKYNYLTASDLDASKVKPTPDFMVQVELIKQRLFALKKASISLKNALSQLEALRLEGFAKHYVIELREQVNALIAEIDFELQELESSINLIFSLQGHRLNEVMKTLTIFSVIFIPLTFLAGIYGMNFKNMPELETENGYYIALAVMACIALLSIWYFYRKKWF